MSLSYIINDKLITEINIGKDDKDIYFTDCISARAKVNIDPSNPYLIYDGYAIYSKDYSQLFKVLDIPKGTYSFTVNDNVRYIHKYAFKNLITSDGYMYILNLPTHKIDVNMHAFDDSHIFRINNISSILHNYMSDNSLKVVLENVKYANFDSNIIKFDKNDDNICIPFDIKTIDFKKLNNLKKVSVISVEEENPKYASYENGIYSKDYTKLLYHANFDRAKEVGLIEYGYGFHRNLMRLSFSDDRFYEDSTFGDLLADHSYEILLHPNCKQIEDDRILHTANAYFKTSNNDSFFTLNGLLIKKSPQYNDFNTFYGRLLYSPMIKGDGNVFGKEIKSVESYVLSQAMISNGSVTFEGIEHLDENNSLCFEPRQSDIYAKAYLPNILTIKTGAISFAGELHLGNNPDISIGEKAITRVDTLVLHDNLKILSDIEDCFEFENDEYLLSDVTEDNDILASNYERTVEHVYSHANNIMSIILIDDNDEVVFNMHLPTFITNIGGAKVRRGFDIGTVNDVFSAESKEERIKNLDLFYIKLFSKGFEISEKGCANEMLVNLFLELCDERFSSKDTLDSLAKKTYSSIACMYFDDLFSEITFHNLTEIYERKLAILARICPGRAEDIINYLYEEDRIEVTTEILNILNEDIESNKLNQGQDDNNSNNDNKYYADDDFDDI